MMPRPDILLIPEGLLQYGLAVVAIWPIEEASLQLESHPNRVAASDFLAAIPALVSHMPRLSDRFSLYTVSCESV